MTPRVNVWCSATELTCSSQPSTEPIHGTYAADRLQNRTGPRAPLARLEQPAEWTRRSRKRFAGICICECPQRRHDYPYHFAVKEPMHYEPS